MKWTSWPLRDLLAPYSMISWICVQFKLNGWPIHWQKSPSISVSPPVEYCTCTLVGGNGTVRTSVWKLNVFYNYSSWLTSNINWCWSMMHFNRVINFPLGTEHWLPNQRAKSEKKKKKKKQIKRTHYGLTMTFIFTGTLRKVVTEAQWINSHCSTQAR